MNDSNLADRLFQEFKRYAPARVVEHANEYFMNDYYELMIVLDNGERYLYDGLNQSFRYVVPYTEEEMTEERFRFEFALRLRRKALKAGLEQRELADLTGISTATLSSYVNGKSTPSFFNIRKIARALGCSSDDFLHFPE